MRTNFVKKAAKDQGNCKKCGKEIKKGDPYKWIQKYRGSKQIACEACQFSDADRTSSDKLATVYEARDTAISEVEGWDGEELDDLKSIMDEFVSEVNDVAGEYRDSADSIRNSFSESSTADECEEKADNLEDWANNCEDPGFDEFDEEDAKKTATETVNKTEGLADDEKEELIEEQVAEIKSQWVDEQRQLALDALNECPM